MRFAYEPPPWLAPDNTPRVNGTSGLGVGGGAWTQTPDSGGFGDIWIKIGTGYTPSLSVTIEFPEGIPTAGLFFSADEEFGPLEIFMDTNQIGIVCTVARFSTPNSSGNGKTYRIHYEWTLST